MRKQHDRFVCGYSQPLKSDQLDHRSTTLVKTRHPVGPYSRTMPRLFCLRCAGGGGSYDLGTPVPTAAYGIETTRAGHTRSFHIREPSHRKAGSILTFLSNHGEYLHLFNQLWQLS